MVKALFFRGLFCGSNLAKGHIVVKRFLLLLGLIVLFAPASFGGASDFGTTGLIKMPDARMEADGTLRATVALDDVANIYNVTFQALPKVQATFRYSIFDPSRARSDALIKTVTEATKSKRRF